MKTLIIPCAGRSSRFPNMKPKWMLTHPDGKLMVEKAIEGMRPESFDRIIITIVKDHSEKYEAKLILQQVFAKNKKVEILELADFTSCQAETVALTLQKKKVKGHFIVKDSDNHAKMERTRHENFVASLHIGTFPREIKRLGSKSFVVANDQAIVTDIVEKRISSEYFCVGIYGFSDAKHFIDAYETLVAQGHAGEIYISHIIAHLIGTGTCVFSHVNTVEYEDWGTLQDWRTAQERHSTYFVDIDGVLMKNVGKYGTCNWSNATEAIEENLSLLKRLQDDGAQVVLTTSRGKGDLKHALAALRRHGIKPHAIVTGCNHAPRFVINDFAPTNPYPCTLAINTPRNGSLANYITLPA